MSTAAPPVLRAPCYGGVSCDNHDRPQPLPYSTSGPGQALVPASPASFGGWVDTYKNTEANALTVTTSLTFAKACAPLFGGCPPSIHPVCAAHPDESITVKSLVDAVNQILERLRACGVIANSVVTQSHRDFYHIGVDGNTFGSVSQDAGGAAGCPGPFTITQTALESFLQINPSAELQRVLQQWVADPGLPPAIDEQTFTQLYLGALSGGG